MRRRDIAAAFAALGVTAAAFAAQAQTLSVPQDQAVRIHLASPARDVVVGNPAVADVQMAGERDLIIIGKGAGVTNVVVVDRIGRTLVNRQIVVSASGAGQVSVYRGPKAQNFVCAPTCQALPTKDDGSIGRP